MWSSSTNFFCGAQCFIRGLDSLSPPPQLRRRMLKLSGATQRCLNMSPINSKKQTNQQNRLPVSGRARVLSNLLLATICNGLTQENKKESELPTWPCFSYFSPFAVAQPGSFLQAGGLVRPPLCPRSDQGVSELMLVNRRGVWAQPLPLAELSRPLPA